MTTLDIAIATYLPQGIERLAATPPPRIDGVRYVISWQEHRDAPIPAPLLRDDIGIWRYDGKGLSCNRNNAFSHCTSEWIMPSDDDLHYYPEGIKGLMEALDGSPECGFATFRAEHDLGRNYPAGTVPLHWPLPKGYNPAVIEMAFRRGTGLRCCPELGLNSPRMHGGEDEALLLSALKRGIAVRFFPVTVSRHDHPSTASRARLTPGNLLAMGCFLALGWPGTAALRVPLKAWRLWRAGQSGLFRALLHLTRGALAAPALLRRNRPTLW